MDDFSIASLNIQDTTEVTSNEESKKLLKDGWYLLNCYTKEGLNVYVLGLPEATVEQRNSSAYEIV